ncbi:MAG: fluoride efflux transporter CrcB, partial [Phycisphaerales bacterium]
PLVLFLVAIAGGLGAACRYILDFAITQRTRGALPWGTWAVNVTGSLALGFLVGLALQISLPVEVKLVLGGGFLGAYTTFSTWMYESLRLIELGAWRAAMVNLLGSVISGGIAAMLGLSAAWGLF